jgi:ABC-type Na+ efflux pump permease subunit
MSERPVRDALILARRDASRLVSDKSFLFMVASQLLLLSVSLTFSQFLPRLMSGSAPVPPSFARVGVVGDDAFWSEFRGGQSMFERTDAGAGLFYYGQGDYDGLIVAENYSARLAGAGPVIVGLYLREGPKKPTILVQVKGALERLDSAARAQRIDGAGNGYVEYRLKAEPAGNSSLVYTVLLPLFIIFLAVAAGNLMITLMANEYEEKTVETLLSTPVMFRDMAFGKALTSFGLVFVQLLVWVAVFGRAGVYVAHPELVMLYGSALVLAFVSFGLLAFAYARTRDSAQNIYAMVMLPCILLLLPFGTVPPEYSWALNLVPSRVVAFAAIDRAIPPGIMAGIAATVALSAALFVASVKISEKRQDN